MSCHDIYIYTAIDFNRLNIVDKDPNANSESMSLVVPVKIPVVIVELQ